MIRNDLKAASLVLALSLAPLAAHAQPGLERSLGDARFV